MSFETIRLLLSWFELGLLFGILFRLAGAFDLIASTQRELRRAIHHLGERHAAELAINNSPRGSGDPVASRALQFRGPKLRYRDRSVTASAVVGLAAQP